MISLKDYNLLYSDAHYDLLTKKNHKAKVYLPFFYLYPSEIELPEKSIYSNEKQHLFTVTQLDNLQESSKVIELIVCKGQVFSPSQQFFVIEHKNPNAQKKFLVISSIDRQHSLKNIAENCFFQNAKVPDEEFCSHLIERILMFVGILEQQGLHMKIITPEHIIIFQGEFYLAYPFPHDVNEASVKMFEQLYQNQKFCAPEILKVISNSKITVNKQLQQSTNTSGIIFNSISLASNMQVKGFKKSILYSLALSIMYSFGFQIPVQDRYSALRNPRHLNNHMNQLRKEVKIHHDGKYISKLLKLMLEHSQSLRDTIKTFLYKMNSVQFQMLKRIVVNRANEKEENIPTESEINSHPNLRTSSGKKTIDIRISSMSNASSLINRSWLSGSHRDGERMISPFDTNKNLPEKKQILQRSHHEITPKERLNEIQEEKNEPGSPIEFDIDWDEDNSMRGSNKSSKSCRSNRRNLKSPSDISDKDKKEPPAILLNKISQKQEGDQDGDGKAEVEKPQKQRQRDFQSDIKISFGSISEQLELKKANEDKKISRTQLGIKREKTGDEHFRTEPQIQDHRLSESDKRDKKKYPKKLQNLRFQEELEDHQIKKNQSNSPKLTTQPYFKTFELSERFSTIKQISGNQPLQMNQFQTSKVHEPSSMTIFMNSQIPTNIQSMELNQSTDFEINPNIEQNNESFIFEQSFGDGEQYQAHQVFLKDAKSKEKNKLTQRKKDQYNERSRVILVTLAVIYVVFQLIDWLLNKQQTVQ